jgi:hypothetical protein
MQSKTIQDSESKQTRNGNRRVPKAFAVYKTEQGATLNREHVKAKPNRFAWRPMAYTHNNNNSPAARSRRKKEPGRMSSACHSRSNEWLKFVANKMHLLLKTPMEMPNQQIRTGRFCSATARPYLV